MVMSVPDQVLYVLFTCMRLSMVMSVPDQVLYVLFHLYETVYGDECTGSSSLCFVSPV